MEQEKTNILLVDDQPSRLLTYEAILERLDQNLVRAYSGAEALAKLDEMEFAAILLDISMPGMNGFETAEQIRDNPRGGQTPIIFVTGVHVTDFDRLKGYEMGAADYVYIPVVPEILRGKVQVLVQMYLQRLELSRLNEQLVAANEDLARAHEQLKAENTRELQELNRSLELANTQLRSEISERRRAEEQLKEAARRKDEFISILAHELRNPLSAIQSGVELMRLPSLPEGKLAWSQKLVERQLRHLTRLIDDLLDVSRVTTGRVRLQREHIDIGTAIAQSIDATRRVIDDKGHELILELPDEPLYVEADLVRLTQVFGNLLTNACKYMDSGGRIVVAVDAVQHPLPRVVTRVRDEGAGLPEHMLERVFELFTQSESPANRTESGLGIGLALVRGLVEMHGGTVHARSEGPGRGCEFVVELPLAARQQAPERARPAQVGRSANPLRLLIIDDNADAADGLALHLRATSPHEIRLANTGASGIAAAIEFEPDVVLLDIGLPDMDGYEVAAELRKHPCLSHAALIAVTGFGGDSDRKRAAASGFDHFLVKPVAHPALEGVLAECAPARTVQS